MNKLQSEAYQNFIQYHIRLNYYVKISTGAVLCLHNYYTEENRLSKKTTKIIVNAGKRWIPKLMKNTHYELILVTNELSKSGRIFIKSFIVVATFINSKKLK